ncbi:hypothetical protein GXW82_22615 [Streptacidiphilus sp. 4-A2]|nr:hypothetical protein [Streptacidiphilus sp. 4-A2]
MSIKHPQARTEEPRSRARARIETARVVEDARRRRRRGLAVGAAAVAVIVGGTAVGIAVQDSRSTSKVPYAAPATRPARDRLRQPERQEHAPGL